MRPETPPVVYFATARAVGMVRIGMTRHWPERMQCLRSWSPVELTVEATTAGGPLVERWLHLRHWADRTHSDWFRLSPAIERDIPVLARGERLRQQPSPTSFPPRRSGEFTRRLAARLGISIREMALAFGLSSATAARNLSVDGLPDIRFADAVYLARSKGIHLTVDELIAQANAFYNLPQKAA